MSNANSLQYFVSQSYRQVQLSVEKGTQPYTYGDFNKQFMELLDASGDEEYTRNMTILLVEEAARLKQTTDYLRQEMAFEAQSSLTGGTSGSTTYAETGFGGNARTDLSVQRLGRHSR
ncbi:hypothetical protein [Spirosoma koreense]